MDAVAFLGVLVFLSALGVYASAFVDPRAFGTEIGERRLLLGLILCVLGAGLTLI